MAPKMLDKSPMAQKTLSRRKSVPELVFDCTLTLEFTEIEQFSTTTLIRTLAKIAPLLIKCTSTLTHLLPTTVTTVPCFLNSYNLRPLKRQRKPAAQQHDTPPSLHSITHCLASTDTATQKAASRILKKIKTGAEDKLYATPHGHGR